MGIRIARRLCWQLPLWLCWYRLLDASGTYLKTAAGIAQVFSDKDFDKWLNSIKKGNYGDNEGDTQMIQAGIDGYVKRKKSK